MKVLNFLLAIAVSLVMAVAVLEGGLRLIGLGPPKTLNRFDPALGWSKKPGVTITRRTSEGFDVTYTFNASGLRDDPDVEPKKPADTLRVVALGDSFTLGFTVEREDLFVDLLEDWWRAEGRAVQVVNTGTEGYSTDQEVAWLLEHGQAWQPDLVLLFAYENDVYWNGQLDYDGRPKPRFDARGQLETGVLVDTDPGGLLARTAIGRLLRGKGRGVARFRPGSREILREFGVLLDPPPAWMEDAIARTEGALSALERRCAELGAKAVVVPIPSHSAIDPAYRAGFEEALGLRGVAWSADRPVELFLEAARRAGIPALDVRAPLAAGTAAGTDLYFQRDWHLNPAGNRVLARFLHDELDRLGVVPPAESVAGLAGPAPEGGGLPTWFTAYLWLLAILGGSYALVYSADEHPAAAVAKVAALLAAVFLIAVGGTRLVALLPDRVGTVVAALVVIAIVGFVCWKLGQRLGTVAELLVAFVGRGHWYLMPLVTVLLTVGSLLVVAASSPLVAPFIYTLF